MKKLGVFFISLIFWNILAAQSPGEDCARTTCGTLNAEWAPVGEAEACEGIKFQVRSSSTPLDTIREYHWYFIEATTNTVLKEQVFTDNSLADFTYEISDSLACSLSESLINLKVTLQIFSKGCATGESCSYKTGPLGVKLRPRADFSIPPEICVGQELSISNASCHATAYEWQFSDTNATRTGENPSYTFNTPGIYTVQLVAANENNCGTDTETRTIRVVGEPEVSFTTNSEPSDNRCENVIINFDVTANEWARTQWEISPVDTNLWCFTDTLMTTNTRNISVKFKEEGEYDFNLIGSNACPESDNQEITIEIFEPPNFFLNAPDPACDELTLSAEDLINTNNIRGDITGYEWTFVNGSISSSPDLLFGDVTFTESGTITLTVFSECDNLTRSVSVVVSSTEMISLEGNPTVFCQNEDPVQFSPSSGGSWSFTDARFNTAISETGELDPSLLDDGNYTLKFEINNADCPNEAELNIEIRETVSVELQEVAPACESLALNTSEIVRYTGEIDSYEWKLGEEILSGEATPILPFTPVNDTLTLTVTGACGTDSMRIPIFVQANTSITINTDMPQLCSGSAPDTLSVNATGGRWVSSGGGFTDDILGIFDPSTVEPDTYTISYQLENGACSSESNELEIEVVASASATIEPTFICTDSETTQLQVTVTDNSTGTWRGQGVNETGLFDPAGLTADSLYIVAFEFTDQNNCDVRSEGEVTIDALPVQSTTDTIQLCLSDIDVDLKSLFNYQVEPADNGTTTWSGAGVQTADGTFNSGSLNVGFHTVFMDYERRDCVVRDSAIIEIIEAMPLALSRDTVICISDSILVLNTNLEGGEWSGTGINQAGEIDLNVGVNGATFTYNYVFLEGTSCEQRGSVEVEIVDLRNEVQAGPNLEACEGISELVLSEARPLGGTWEGTGVNPTSGRVDISMLNLDSTYTYIYEVESELVTACAATASRTFIIHSNPVAAFELDGTACINEEFSLQNNSENAARYEWDFGDGTTRNEAMPTHQYTNQDTYTISLTAYSEFNCENTSTRELFVTTPPIANFELLNDEGCAPFEVEITNLSSGFDISQRWLVNNDTILGAELTNVILDSITDDTRFTIQLEVENLCGPRTDTASVLVRPYPLADFGINQDEGCSPSLIELSNTALGNPDSLIWNFGNGNTFTGTDSLLYQTYTTGDTTISTYTIDFLAINECGRDSISKEVQVFPPNVRAFIEQDTLRGCTPLAVNLESFSTPEAAISWRIWNENGLVLEGYNSKVLNDTLFEAGFYTVELAAAQCGIHFDTAFIEVLPAPLVNFEISRPYVCEGDTLRFLNTSEAFNSSLWDFGDGMVSGARSPAHQFDTAGVYQVSLTVISSAENACPATITKAVNVVGNPNASFGMNTNTGCVPLSVQFSNQSEGFSELRYLWTFEHLDGDCSNASTEASPSYTFECPGQYSVQLVVYDENECFADTMAANVFVFDLPESRFEFEDKQYCFGYDAIDLINLSSEDAVRYEWVIEGDTLSQNNPSYMPTQAGVLDIELIAYNRNECAHSSQKQVLIEASPMANFAPSVVQGCEDLVVQFDNQSLAADGYSWLFDNGNFSTNENPRQIFTEAGIYTVTLIATNSNACPAHTFSAPIEVYPKPTADFDVEKTRLCGTPSEVHFINLSELNADNTWSFGNGNNSEATSPSNRYLESGIFKVQLIVETAQTCKDTLEQEVEIFGQPTAMAQISPTENCEGFAVQFLDVSTERLSTEWWIEDKGTFTSVEHIDSFQKAGAYDVRLIASYNEVCKDTLFLMDTIRVYKSPIADFTYQAEFDPNILGEVQFDNRSLFFDRCLWDFGDGKASTLSSPYHEYRINRFLDVLLTVYNDNGGTFTCTDTISMQVAPEWQKTFYAPNAFAPEYGTGGVEVFRPVGVGIEAYRITVYAPWGGQLWYSENLADGWNGRLQNTGELLPQGAYVWHAWMRYEDGNEYEETGTVTLLR